MTLHAFSASSWERADKCPPSHFLPRVYDGPSTAALIGVAVHDFIVRARSEGRDEAIATVDEDAEHYAFCVNLQLDKLPQGGQMEVAYAYDPEARTARILGLNIGRAYVEHGLLPHEVAGTADLVGVQDDTVVVIDWKTGFFGLGPAARSHQLRFLALCACKALGLMKARVSFWYLREDGTMHETPADFDAFDIEQIADEVSNTLATLAAAASAAAPVPDVWRGTWCRFCESKAHCPAFRNAIGELVQLKSGAPLDRDRRGEAWQMLEYLRPVVDEIDATLRDWAREEPFKTPDGRVVKPIIVQKEKLNVKIAKPVVAKMLGDQVADAAAKWTMSKAGLHDAVRDHAKSTGQKISHVEKEVWKAIADAGGVKTVNETQVRAVKAAS